MPENPFFKWAVIILIALFGYSGALKVYSDITKPSAQRKFDDCIQRVAGRQIGEGVREAQIICLREQ